MKEFDLDRWFHGTDFPTMELMFKIRQTNYRPDNGYQEFVNACEYRWNLLSYKEKKYFYKEYGNK